MEFFNKTKAVKLRSNLNKYLVADDDNTSVRLCRNGLTRKARWIVELVDFNPRAIRLKSIHGSYLTASSATFLLGFTGKKVLQTRPDHPRDLSIEWAPVRDGSQVRLVTAFGGTCLRANGGTPLWKNSVTHDGRSVKQKSIMWEVEEVEIAENEEVEEVAENEEVTDYLTEIGSPVSMRSSNSPLRSKNNAENALYSSWPPNIEIPSKHKISSGMELFHNAKTVRLRGHHDKYLSAEEDEESVTQDHNGSNNACWTVEFVSDSINIIRLKSCYDTYLTASNKHFLLGMTSRKVLQTAGLLDSSVEWEPIRDGNQVKLKTRNGKFLQANGSVPPWQNSVTHDVPNQMATQDWILWDVDVVEIVLLPSPQSKMGDQLDSEVYPESDSEVYPESDSDSGSSLNSNHWNKSPRSVRQEASISQLPQLKPGVQLDSDTYLESSKSGSSSNQNHCDKSPIVVRQEKNAKNALYSSWLPKIKFSSKNKSPQPKMGDQLDSDSYPESLKSGSSLNQNHGNKSPNVGQEASLSQLPQLKPDVQLDSDISLKLSGSESSSNQNHRDKSPIVVRQENNAENALNSSWFPSLKLSSKKKTKKFHQLTSFPQIQSWVELFPNAKVVRLRNRHDKYLSAEEDEESVTQDHNTSNNAYWTVEYVPKSNNIIRLKSCYEKYLTASNKHFLLGMTGRKVLQTAGCLDSSVEWEPIRDGHQVKLKTRHGKYLQANGDVPPWWNSVTHDVPSQTATQDWILWDVDVVEIESLQLPKPAAQLDSDVHPESLESELSWNQNYWDKSPPRYERQEPNMLQGPQPKPEPGVQLGLDMYLESLESGSSSNQNQWDMSPRFGREKSIDSKGSSGSKSADGRVISYSVTDEYGNVEEGSEERSFVFKGNGLYELTTRLEEETGFEDIIVCARSPLDGKLKPLRLQLPPQNVNMHIVVVPSSS